MTLGIEPIGHVETARSEAADDFWGDTEAVILLDERFEADSLQGIEDFSHAEILFYFDRVD